MQQYVVRTSRETYPRTGCYGPFEDRAMAELTAANVSSQWEYVSIDEESVFFDEET